MHQHVPPPEFETSGWLPYEILLAIFKILFEENRGAVESPLAPSSWDSEEEGSPAPSPRDSGSYRTEWMPEPNLLSPSLFPRSPASVSTSWRNVMASFPEFWTRIVIILDDSPNCITFALCQLQYSGSLPITIDVITGDKDLFLEHPEKEMQISRQVIDAISPHMSRCTSLKFDVKFSSSLPRIATDFQEIAPSLQNLELYCDIGMQLPKDGRSPALFSFPKVEKITLDGWNFVDICTSAKWWFEKLASADTTAPFLHVRHYYPDCNEDERDRFIVNDAFIELGKVYGLSLDSVDFHSTEEITTGVATLENETLVLSNLTPTLTSNLMRNVSHLYAGVALTNCSLSEVVFLPGFPALSLHDNHETGLSTQLQALLPNWRGDELTFNRCSINDDILQLIGKTHMERDDTTGIVERLNCPVLRDLLITSCSGWSIRGLRALVEGRREYNLEIPVGTLNNWNGFSIMIEGQELVGDDEDMRWLRSTFSSSGSLWRYSS